jgi:hypothetical protein
MMDMNPRLILATMTILTSALLSGCAELSITVYQYKGDLSHSYRVRLVEARGKANQAIAQIESEPTLKAYLEKLETGGSTPTLPKLYIKRINGIVDASDPALPMGLPKIENRPPHKETEAEEKARYARNENTKNKLNNLEKEIVEFGSFLIRLSLKDVSSTAPAKDPEHLERTIEQLRVLGSEMVRHVEFPDFSDVISEKDQWIEINPVRTFGGCGKSEFVVYKDETGNYQIKSAIFDPSEVAQAARKAVTKVLTTVAAAYGVPLGGALGNGGGGAQAQAPLTVSTIRLATQKLKDQIDLMRAQNSALDERLRAVRGAIPATLAGDAAKTAAVDNILRELAAYEKNIAAIEQK